MKNTLHNIFQNHPIDSVIHFAGVKTIRESVEKLFKHHKCQYWRDLELSSFYKKLNFYQIDFSFNATVYDKPERLHRS